MREPSRGPGFLAGFLFGLLVGAVLGLLFAPQSGRQTRSDIAERGIELLPVGAEELSERVSTLLAAQRQRIAEARAAAREAAEQARAELRARYERARRGEA